MFYFILMDWYIIHCLADIAAAQCTWTVFPETLQIAETDVALKQLANHSNDINRDDRQLAFPATTAFFWKMHLIGLKLLADMCSLFHLKRTHQLEWLRSHDCYARRWKTEVLCSRNLVEGD